jgi:hypothetical protein
MSLARSFIKGPRFAFHHKEQLMACERCVFGTGKHTCPATRPGNVKPSLRSAVPGKPLGPALRALMNKYSVRRVRGWKSRLLLLAGRSGVRHALDADRKQSPTSI